MVNSIRYFEKECINRFEKLEDEFLKDPTRLAEYIHGITDELHKLGVVMIKESLETMDRILGLDPGERITEDAEAKLLEEAVQSSYRRGGEEVSLTSEVSKQTVMNKIHALYKTRIMCYCTNRQPVGRGVNDANRKRSSRAQK